VIAIAFVVATLMFTSLIAYLVRDPRQRATSSRVGERRAADRGPRA
jgi:hypothetical protein